MLDILFILLGLMGLFVGGDSLVKGAAHLAKSFGISSLIIGLTVVSLGTSMPELIVNVSAALNGSTRLALGNVIGSNIANVGLILALAGVVTPLMVHVSLIRREIPIAIGLSMFLYFVALDGEINTIEGIILVCCMVAVSGLFYYLSQHATEPPSDGYVFTEKVNRFFELGRIAGGIAILVVGAQLMVIGATNIAEALGVSDLVIGLTLVAFGTSLPELAASLAAAVRRETDILVGNIIGSNIYNIVLVLGVTSIIRNVPVDDVALRIQFPVMLAFIILMVPFSVNKRFGRWEGLTFLLGYVAFLGITFVN